MLIFALSAAVFAAALAGLVLWRAAKAQSPGVEAPEAGVYARQLAELDSDRAQGLIDEAAWKAARAEAGRRLLKASDGEGAGALRDGSRSDRALVLGGAVAAVLLGGLIYVAVGQPARPDEPFAARMAQWRAHPQALGAAETAAVLKEEVRAHPQDPALWARLGAAYFESRQLYPAAQAFEQTTRLAPNDPRGWLALGDTRLAAAEGKAEPQVVEAYRHAIALEPRVADFILAEARQGVGEGHPAEAVMLLRAASVSLPVGDVRKATFDETIAQAQRQESEVAQVLAASPEQQMQMMRANVARLADRLDHERGDVQQWSMLVRSYGMLGDTAARDKALARARILFTGQDLAAIEAAAQGPRS